MLEKNKESQTQSLAELQQELKSLKALLLSRNANVPSGFSTPVIPSKPQIPPWQLSGSPTNPPKSPSPALPSSNSTSIPIPTPTVVPNGKGKEVELGSDASSS